MSTIFFFFLLTLIWTCFTIVFRYMIYLFEVFMLNFIGSYRLSGDELLIFDPMVNKINISSYGIPLYQQKKMLVQLVEGEYSLHEDGQGNFLLILRDYEHNKSLRFAYSEKFSSSFSGVICISSVDECSHTVDEYVESARFDAGKMYSALRRKKHIRRDTLNRLNNQAKQGIYPYVSDYDDPVIISSINSIPNTSWSDYILEKCSNGDVIQTSGGISFRTFVGGDFLGTIIQDSNDRSVGILITCENTQNESFTMIEEFF